LGRHDVLKISWLSHRAGKVRYGIAKHQYWISVR
jgi:hypothetical protein